MPDEYLTVREAAARLGLSERTIRRYAAARGLPCIRLPGRTLIPRRELEDWLAAQMVPRGGDDLVRHHRG